jgi:hypothetical protein
VELNKDVFSSGQVGSKIWLCEQLEKTNWKSDMTWIYGGWHGMMGFLLLSRAQFPVDRIRSFDKDPICERVADTICENWVWKDWTFKAFTADCDELRPNDVDLIINTSTEHFETMDWWDNIPDGTRVAIQGNNMRHEEDTVIINSLEEFKTAYPLTHTVYQGQLDFKYPNWSFSRYMLIGVK